MGNVITLRRRTLSWRRYDHDKDTVVEKGRNLDTDAVVPHISAESACVKIAAEVNESTGRKADGRVCMTP